MKRFCIGLWALALGACGHDRSEDEIEAGQVARELGVRLYRTKHVEDRGVIRLIAEGGTWIGDLELIPLRVGDVAFAGEDGFVLTDAFADRFAYVRVRFKNAKFDREVATFVGPERPGYACPTPFYPPTVRVTNAWSAALADPALAPFLGEFELTIEPRVREDFVNEQPFDAGNHVGDCAGHRVVALGGDYDYYFCSNNPPNQTMYNGHGGDPAYWCDVTRYCWGGSAGNGFDPPGNPGGTCCNGGDCSHPSPSGLSTQPDCTTPPMSGNGCKSTGETCGCDAHSCLSTCTNSCDEFDYDCC